MEIATILRAVAGLNAESTLDGLLKRAAQLSSDLVPGSRLWVQLAAGASFPQPAEGAAADLMQRAQQTDQPQTSAGAICVPLRTADGQTLGALYVGLPAGAKGGDLALWEAVGSCIAEHLHQRDRLTTLEKGSVDARMVSSFAHVMRNALTSTTFCFEAIHLTLEDPAHADINETREALEAARRGVDRALRVTSRISEFAQANKQASSQPASAGVGRTVQSVLYRLSSDLKAQHIRVEQDINTPLVVQMTDLHLQTLLTNLLSNARDALQEVQPLDGRCIQLHAQDKGGMAEIVVTDNGTGISQEAMGRLFEPFFSTKGSRGTGMGLALCRRLVDLYGGDITILRDQPLGTSVQVRLPLNRLQ